MAIIFDFNGTMFKDTVYHDQAWKQIGGELRGKPVADEELKNHIHGSINERIIDYLVDVDKATNKQISLKKEAYYRRLVKQAETAKLVDGLEDFMDYAKEHNIPMTIASASIQENINFFYEFFDLGRWFSKKDIFFDDGSYENKQAMFADAAKHMKRTPEQCIVFEDSLTGVSFAEAAGVQQIVVIGDQAPEKEQVMFYIEDFTDPRIYELLEKE